MVGDLERLKTSETNANNRLFEYTFFITPGDSFATIREYSEPSDAP